MTRTIRLGHSPQGVAVVDGAVWVALQASPAHAAAVRAGRATDVLSVVRPQGLEGVDPAVTPGGNQIFHATCALLLNYSDRPFPEGAQLVPEVAREMPSVSDDGRTYTFRIRPGFRFSPPSNAAVTAEAFRRTIERTLHPRTKSYAPTFMTDIVGLPAFQAGRAKHLAGVSARGDTLTVRLKAPSATLPARLATLYFCAVPHEHADLCRRGSRRSRWPGRTTSPPSRPSAGSCCAGTRTTVAAGRRGSGRSRSILTSPPLAP